MSTKIKKSANIMAGYVYQTMQGVNLICDWLDSPTRYKRIRLECDESAIVRAGLDDLVAERPNGRIDLWQIKFSPSQEKHPLDWDWLLEKKGKPGGTARTNLRKWFDSFDAIEPDRLGDIRLLTNRMPDLVMEKCLAGERFIDYTLAPADIQARVEQALDGEANALRFFKVLEVRHSDKSFSSIETHVTQRLRKHATVEGIETLKNKAVSWSIVKNQPTDDGWITFAILQSTLGAIAPEPLPEDFVIPQSYRVPDTQFHKKFMASIQAAPKQPIVLTGPPGRGKSTYLSKVCELLQNEDIPFVRHHYYLSATDRSIDRYTSFAVQESILAQVAEYHPDVAVSDRTLNSVVAACVSHYGKLSKPFVVIVDGLDHVWRTQGFDKRALDDVFNQLLPAPNNLVLVVGTQPVDDVQLPSPLLDEAPRTTWLELPAMSADAVLQYLRKELKQGRLRISGAKSMAETELQSAAAKMRERTSGHPLHVIYATEELIRSGKELSTWDIEQLSGDLSSDAKTYYSSLWRNLTASQKDVLRLIAEFPFFWPRHAFAEIAALAGAPRPEVAAVEHLLHASAAGLRPFHESLIVFVRQTIDYERRVAELAGFVETWLDIQAPKALRVNWLWSVKAKRGQPDELIAGLQRDWVLERLREGYPNELFEKLLKDAEEQALQRVRYADAYRLRHLKYRLLNSLSYQLMGKDAARLKACTWTLAPDGNVVDEAFASRHEMAVVDVAALGLALSARGNLPAAIDCAREALARHRGESRFATQNRSTEAQAKVLYLVKACSRIGALDAAPQEEAKWLAERWGPMARTHLEARVENDLLRKLVEVAVMLPDGESKQMACDAAFRTAGLAEVEISAWSEFKMMSWGSLIGCVKVLAKDDSQVRSMPLDYEWQEGGYQESREALAGFAHGWFFGGAYLELAAGKDASTLPCPKFNKREDVAGYLDRLAEVGREFAQRWHSGQAVNFSELYEKFHAIPFFTYGQGYERGQAAVDFRRTLHTIAIDIQLMGTRVGLAPLVGSADLQHAMKQVWFDAAEFRTQYVSGLAKILSNDAAEAFVRHQLAEFDANVNEETGQRMMAMLELCEMALRHGINDVAGDLCLRTWELALGYAQRKDSALSDVMYALEYLMPIAPDDARRLLMEVAPQVHNVLTYTDGKGTRHIIAQADELLAGLDRRALVEKYHAHTEVADWSFAEDSLRTFITTESSENPFSTAVLRTGIHLEAIESLEGAASRGVVHAANMLGVVQTHRGDDVGRINDLRSKGSGTEWKQFEGDVTTYPVSDLARLQHDLKDHYGIRGEVLTQWFSYWDAQGQGSQLISALEPALLSESCRDNDMSELLDLAFETKLRLEGAARAFPYIVQAQVFKGGWSAQMERVEKAEERLRKVAATYKRRCDEFFIKSSFSWLDRPKRSRVIPSEIMVYFLGLQGRTVEAVQFAEAMVRSVQEDTRTLFLSAPSWSEKLPHSNVELELLITRVRWPLASTRWWAMQELALLLIAPETHAEVAARLMAELRLCRLEAETVELLGIFWMAFMRGVAVPQELGNAVQHWSLIAERYLADMGQKTQSSAMPTLQVAPKDFQVAASFERVQGSDVPRIFATIMTCLQEQARLPFMRQFAYEWSLTESAYPEAPHQGDLAFFIRPAGNNATGSFANRSLLRMLTAFQRTLEVAHTLWKMPPGIAFNVACCALPFEPTLAFLRPARPLWIPSLGATVVESNASITEFLKAIDQGLKEAGQGKVLFALTTPVLVRDLEILELTVVRFRQFESRTVIAKSLAETMDSRRSTLGTFEANVWGTRSEVTSLMLTDVVDAATLSAPMAAIHDIDRVGYLQKDLYPSRLFMPVATGTRAVIVAPSGGELAISIDGTDCATSVYWNAGWMPCHPQEMSGLCGTALFGDAAALSAAGEPAAENHFYLWTVTRFKRERGHDVYENSAPSYGIHKLTSS